MTSLATFKDINIPRDNLTEEEYQKVKQVNSLKGWILFLTILILLTSIPHLVNWCKNIWQFTSKRDLYSPK